MQAKVVFICLAAALGTSAGAAADAWAAPDAQVAQSAVDAGVNANAAVDGSSLLTAGSIVKDSRGATIGKIERMVTAPGGDRVVLRVGNELIAVPASTLDASGKFLTTTQSKSQLRAMARGSGG